MTTPTHIVPVIHRFEVPVDDKWHRATLFGPIVHVGARRIDPVEFWTMNNSPVPTQLDLRIYGNGQPIEDHGAQYVGTAMVPGGTLVWHLISKPVP